MAVDGKALATSLGINGGLCAIFLLLFSVLRVGGITRRFYAPKRCGLGHALCTGRRIDRSRWLREAEGSCDSSYVQWTPWAAS